MSAEFFEKIVNKEKKHKKKKEVKGITAEDLIAATHKSKKKGNIGDVLAQVARSYNQGESGGAGDYGSTLKVPEYDHSGSSSDRDSRRSSRSRNSVSAERSPRRSQTDQEQRESMYNFEQSNMNQNSESSGKETNLQPMSPDEAKKYDILLPFLDPSDRPSNLNEVNLELDSGARVSNQAPYPQSNSGVQPPSLPYPFDQNNMSSMPDPTVYLCDMNHQLRSLVIKRLKSCWDVSNPLKSVEPLIEELNQTQGREWRLDMVDNPCDLTGSRAFKGNVLSFSFDSSSKPYVLWRRQTGEFNSGYNEWLW